MTTKILIKEPLWYHFECDYCSKVINSASYECRDKHMLEEHDIDWNYQKPKEEQDLIDWYAKKGINV